MRFFKLTILACCSIVAAQRPGNATICDYYANQLFGTNTSVTQIQLVKHIMSLAFAGTGNMTFANLSSTFVGIMQPYPAVDLRGFFNGTLNTTNENGSPGMINWLDGNSTVGGDPLAPVHDFLSGKAPDVIFPEGSNEFLLFDHFFVAFAKLFGCSVIPSWSIGPTNPPNPAYVHKYMDLNQLQLSHFINQVTDASRAYGFSLQDAQQLNNTWNDMFNVRCAGPEPFTPGAEPQLLSLCQDPSCPVPIDGSANCTAYNDLTQAGAGLNPSATIAINVGATASATTSATSSSTGAAASSSSGGLSTGAIVGIVIGVVALIVIAALVFFYMRHKKTQKKRRAEEAAATAAAATLAAEHEKKMHDLHYSGSMHSHDHSQYTSPKYNYHTSLASNPSGYGGHNSSLYPESTMPGTPQFGTQQLSPIIDMHEPAPVEIGDGRLSRYEMDGGGTTEKAMSDETKVGGDEESPVVGKGTAL